MHYTWQVPKIRRFVGLRLPSPVACWHKPTSRLLPEWHPHGHTLLMVGRCLGAHATRSAKKFSWAGSQKKGTFIARYTTRTSFSWDLGNWHWNLEVNSAGGRLNQNAHQGEARTSAFCENIQTAHITAAGATDEEGDLKKVHGASPTPTGHIPGGTQQRF